MTKEQNRSAALPRLKAEGGGSSGCCALKMPVAFDSGEMETESDFAPFGKEAGNVSELRSGAGTFRGGCGAKTVGIQSQRRRGGRVGI